MLRLHVLVTIALQVNVTKYSQTDNRKLSQNMLSLIGEGLHPYNGVRFFNACCFQDLPSLKYLPFPKRWRRFQWTER